MVNSSNNQTVTTDNWNVVLVRDLKPEKMNSTCIWNFTKSLKKKNARNMQEKLWCDAQLIDIEQDWHLFLSFNTVI